MPENLKNSIFLNLNPEQKRAVTYKNGPLLIVAGAGTGKTTVITQRIAWLIEQNLAKPDEILALTFTDKAAGEMEERVDRLLPMGYLDLWIMTFHSFCENVLKDHALDIGIPNDFKLLNQTEQWMLVRQNLDKFNLDYYKPLGNPTKFIHALIKHFSRCKDEDIGPQEYLKYAEGLKLDVDSMESTGGHGGNFQFPISNFQKKPKLQKQKNSTSNVTIEKSNNEIDSNEIKRLEEVASAYHIYQQLLLDNNSLDFGDLINYCLRLFQTRPNILKLYQNKFKYILVDEFQDTNYAQYQLIKLLSGKEANITVVLDDDQSIYMWRGASYNNALQFKKDYPKLEQISLIQNYRSAQNILDLAYSFIQLNNPERLEAQDKSGKLSKKLKSNLKVQGIVEHLHTATEYNEIEAVINKIIDLKNKDCRGTKYCASTWNDFAILIRTNSMAEGYIAGLHNAEVPHMFLSARGLYNKPIILDIIAYLKLCDNYHESKALFRMLNWLIYDIDPRSIAKISYFARKKTLSIYEALHRSPAELKFPIEIYENISKILKMIDQGAVLAKSKPVSQIVLNLFKNSGWGKYLISRDDKYSRDSLKYINNFYKIIQEFEKSFDDKSVKNFLEQIDMEMEAGDSGAVSLDLDEGPEAVKIMTIHGAKGLEFKYVFIVNLVDKRFPTIAHKEPIDIPDELIKEIIPKGDVHLQEERRLFYVAMTRAGRGLFFTSALDYGGARKKKLSRFLHEIGLGNMQDTRYQPEADQPLAGKLQEKSNLQSSNETIKQFSNEFPSRFSFTQLKAYESCPWQYKLAHVFRVPITGKPSFSFGKTMHSTLQKFFTEYKQREEVAQGDLFDKKIKTERGKLPALDELYKMYEESWVDDWYEDKKQKEDYKKKGKEILKEFYEKIKGNMPNVKFLEKGFNFKINDNSIRGVMDRVDELKNGTLEIIDYKTGSVKDEKYIEKDQLLIYQMAAKELLDKKVSKLTFYYLNENKPVSFLGTDKEIEKQQNKINDIIAGIRQQKFGAKPSKFTCLYCDFKDICEHRVI
ncbi:MAG: UvrD-helicase domain-containing protein [Candidatus Kuenenbacteria bacterium]